MSATNEMWQVMCDDGSIFETDMEGLKQWAAEGRILPTDRVRKGNLRWIEAGLAPLLRGAFNREPSLAGSYTPAVQSAVQPASTPHGPEFSSQQHEGFDDYAQAQAPDAPFVNEAYPHDAYANETYTQETYAHEAYARDAYAHEAYRQAHALNAAGCYYHPEVRPKFVCRACANTFCAGCVKQASITVSICQLCGELCRLYEEERQKSVRRMHQSTAFGIEDFGTALSYPFKNIFSLLGGAFFYALLLLAGFKGHLLASAILFGCISFVINKVAAGRMDKDFLPDLSSFSWWDDFIVPLFLGVGVTIVTMGPAILIALALIFGIVKSAPSTADRTPVISQNPQEQPLTEKEVEELMEGTGARTEEQLRDMTERPLPARSTEGADAGDESSLSTLRWLFGVSAIVIPFLLLALVWAVFYYPMALAVAGYTEDFWSVINPLVGLDTIRRMGATYFKAFGMYLAVQSIGFVLNLLTHAVLAPFSMPIVGNLPARFVNGMITFYASLVIACILGLALFKSADRLGIATD